MSPVSLSTTEVPRGGSLEPAELEVSSQEDARGRQGNAALDAFAEMRPITPNVTHGEDVQDLTDVLRCA